MVPCWHALSKKHRSSVAGHEAIIEVVVGAGHKIKRGVEPSSPTLEARRDLSMALSGLNAAPLLESGAKGSSSGPSTKGRIHALPLRFTNFTGFGDPHMISHFASDGAR